ncbi:MAG: aminotransferase class V-fold PLP-dependent enzyme, partial [Xanthobacteraceae bacterium]|nr:aminotransferase class V-fold PLP-dependent enzyme [Xanthobacteraceae bacterium]
RCWEDAARLTGDKWQVVLGDMLPALQSGIAAILQLPDPRTIAIAPNTHAFVNRILSCFPSSRPVRILTTDAEFHSFRRQVARLEEDGLVSCTYVSAEPVESFAARFRDAAATGGCDLVFVSQVFFTSGATSGDLASLVAAVRDEETFVVIDGYHGYMARPTDLSGIAGRAFYMAGGYKYAMAGEGICFLHCPPGYGPRPRDTGWFAEFGALATPAGKSVGYPEDGSRFLGATFDPVGMYRMQAVLTWLTSAGIGIGDVHAHATALMEHFLARLAPLGLKGLRRRDLVTPFGNGAAHGNFLAFQAPHAAAIEKALAAAGIQADHRGERMRFGFGLALTRDEIDAAVERMASVLADI